VVCRTSIQSLSTRSSTVEGAVFHSLQMGDRLLMWLEEDGACESRLCRDLGCIARSPVGYRMLQDDDALLG
jgi:hypothetical protein